MSQAENEPQTFTEKLRNMVLDGDFKAGERLQETRLVQMIGGSRTPARIALRALATEGLLTYKPNCGYEVCEVTTKRLTSAYELRAELEALACSNAAKIGLDTKSHEILQFCLDTGDNILSTGSLHADDKDRYREMNRTFHDTIIKVSGNELLGTFVERASNIFQASSKMVVWSDFFVVKRSHDDHHRIFRALQDRDSMRAKSLMLEHISYAGEYLMKHIENTTPHQDGGDAS